MKVFVINLDKDKDRMESVDAQLRKLGVDYERVSGVYAKEMPEEERNRAVNRFRWWCAMGRKVRDGEIGCALSHLMVYEKILQEDINVACILEDDVVLDARFPCVLRHLEVTYDSKCNDVMLLSNHSDPNGQEGDHLHGYRSPTDFRGFKMIPTRCDMFTEGYVIGKCACAALLKQNKPIIVPADAWTRWSRNKAIQLFHVFPTVCSQDKDRFVSTTVIGEVKTTKDMVAIEYIIHKAKRVVGVVFDWFLRLVTRR